MKNNNDLPEQFAVKITSGTFDSQLVIDWFNKNRPYSDGRIHKYISQSGFCVSVDMNEKKWFGDYDDSIPAIKKRFPTISILTPAEFLKLLESAEEFTQGEMVEVRHSEGDTWDVTPYIYLCSVPQCFSPFRVVQSHHNENYKNGQKVFSQSVYAIRKIQLKQQITVDSLLKSYCNKHGIKLTDIEVI